MTGQYEKVEQQISTPQQAYAEKTFQDIYWVLWAMFPEEISVLSEIITFLILQHVSVFEFLYDWVILKIAARVVLFGKCFLWKC